MSEVLNSGDQEGITPFDPASGQAFRDYVLKQTAVIHQQAEEGSFMTSVTSGVVSQSDYAVYVRMLHFVYDRMEALARKPGIPEDISAFVSQVARAGALAEDYKMLTDFSPEDASLPTPAPAQKRYLDYLEKISKEPVKLLAHLYIRYGGDMAGGRVMRKKLADIGWNQNVLNFFDLGDKEAIMAMRKNLHGLLNHVPEKYAGSETVFVKEALCAFEYNIEMLEELPTLLKKQ